MPGELSIILVQSEERPRSLLIDSNAGEQGRPEVKSVGRKVLKPESRGPVKMGSKPWLRTPESFRLMNGDHLSFLS